MKIVNCEMIPKKLTAGEHVRDSQTAAVSETEAAVSLRWQPVPVAQVVLREGRRAVDPQHVAALKASFVRLGGQLQLQPIVIDAEYALIDGAHRLEAAKQSQWSYISAMVVSGAGQIDRPLLEAEANLVRRRLSVLELEEVWRTHYEPELRSSARRRKLAALLQHAHSSPSLQSAQDEEFVEPVIGISDNGGEGSPESLARVAKRITGFSLDTLNKVAQIRALSVAAGAPTELRSAAVAGLAKLTSPKVSVESVYRALRNLQQRTEGASVSTEMGRAHEDEIALERVLSETSLLAERLSGPLATQVFSAAGKSRANREMLRAARVSLAHSLATVVALECNLEVQSAHALTRIGAEVSRLLSRTSRSQIDKRGSSGQAEPITPHAARQATDEGQADRVGASESEQFDQIGKSDSGGLGGWADERAAA